MNTAENKPVERAALGQDFPRLQSGAHVVQGAGVHVARLAALKAGVKLEARGMTRRGKSCTMIVRQMFNLPVGTSRDTLIERLEKEIKEYLPA